MATEKKVNYVHYLKAAIVNICALLHGLLCEIQMPFADY